MQFLSRVPRIDELRAKKSCASEIITRLENFKHWRILPDAAPATSEIANAIDVAGGPFQLNPLAESLHVVLC